MIKQRKAKTLRLCLSGRGVALFLAGLLPAGGAVVVASATNPANGHIYHVVTGTVSEDNPGGGLSWTEAETFSRTFATGGDSAYLASITTMQEQQWIMDQFADPGFDFSSPLNLFWIGLSDQNVEGEFLWESGETSTYRNWAGGALPPDPTGLEDYAYFENTSAFEPLLVRGEINDHEDQRTFSGIMPFSALVEVVPVPEPSALMLAVLVLPLALRRRRNGFS